MKEVIIGVYKLSSNIPIQNCSIHDAENTQFNIKSNISKKSTELLVAEPCNYSYKANYSQIDLGHILLIGSTSFLGVHLLNELVQETTSNIYCLITDYTFKGAMDKLRKVLNYYFKNNLLCLLNKRIFVLKGDISTHNLGLSNDDLNVVTQNITSVFHAVLLSNYFRDPNKSKTITIQGTSNIAKLCNVHKKKLHFLSSIGVCGSNINSENHSKHIPICAPIHITEALYVPSNIFINYQSQAENIIQTEMQNGLTATIYRLGNITERYRDGRYKKNIMDNIFHNALKAIIDLGVVHYSMLKQSLEFTPVDFCSKAIISLSMLKNSQNKIFCLVNPNMIDTNKFLLFLSCIGISIDKMDDGPIDHFISYLSNNIRTKQRSLSFVLKYVEALSDEKPGGYVIDLNNNQANAYLSNIGFKWPSINLEYIQKVIKHWIDSDYLFG